MWNFIYNKIYSQKHPYHTLTPSCFPTTTGTSIGWFLAIMALTLHGYNFFDNFITDCVFLLAPLISLPQDIFWRIVHRLTPRLMKEKGFIIWFSATLLGPLAIPFTFRGGIDDYTCSWCFAILLSCWFVFLLYHAYCEQRLAFSIIWSEFAKMYKTIPEFQILFVVKFLSDVFVFHAMVNSLFSAYMIYPLLVCWVATFLAGGAYSYFNVALAFWLLSWIIMAGCSIILIVKLLPKTLKWIFSYFDKANLYLIIGNPGSKVAKGLFALTAAATTMVIIPTGVGLGADALTRYDCKKYLDIRYNDYVDRLGHRPSEETYLKWLKENDDMVKDSLVMPKLTNVIQTITGFRSRRP